MFCKREGRIQGETGLCVCKVAEYNIPNFFSVFNENLRGLRSIGGVLEETQGLSFLFDRLAVMWLINSILEQLSVT